MRIFEFLHLTKSLFTLTILPTWRRGFYVRLSDVTAGLENAKRADVAGTRCSLGPGCVLVVPGNTKQVMSRMISGLTKRDR